MTDAPARQTTMAHRRIAQTDEKVENATLTPRRGGIPLQGTPSATDDAFRVAAFGEFDIVYAVARLISGSTTGATNALPPVMLSAYRGWPGRPLDIRPLVWMLTMLVDHFETTGAASIATAFAEPETEGKPSNAKDGLSFAALRHTIRGMALQDRAVLALSDVASLSYDEVGRVLDVGRAEVRDRLFGARARLKRSLNADSASLRAVGSKE